MRIRVAVSAVLVLAAVAAPSAAARSTRAIAPYHRPSFRCRFVHFADGQVPNLRKYPQDPFCVDYSKRDITVDDGGAVRFAVAEPSRFVLAGPRCRYWQTDHWSVQLDRGYGPIVRWDGSYWWDKRAGVGAAILRNFTIAGQPVGAWQAAAAVQTVDPSVAAKIRAYGAGPGGGGGAFFRLPGGIRCG